MTPIELRSGPPSPSRNHSLRRASVRRLIACVVATLCSPAHGHDLLSAFHYALDDDRRFAMTQSRLDSANARSDESRSALLPQVGLRVAAGWNDETYRSPTERSRYGANGYGVVLTQPLYRVSSVIQKEQATLAIQAAELRRVAARQDLALRVARAYVGVLQYRARARACVAQVEAMNAQQARIERLLSEGAATQPDAQEVQARVDSAQSDLAAARSEIALRQESLRQIAGPVDEALADLRPDVELQPPQPVDMASWADAAQRDNLEAQAAAVEVEIARRETDVQRSARLPTLDLIGIHGRFSQDGGVIFGLSIPSNAVSQTTVALRLTVPLFTGGAIDSRVRQADAAREIAADAAEEARRGAMLAARQAYVAVVTGLERIRADRQALASSRSTLASIQLAFDLGKRLVADVLNAQQQLAAADQRLQQTRYDTLLAQLQLKAATGTLDDAEMARVNELLRAP